MLLHLHFFFSRIYQNVCVVPFVSLTHASSAVTAKIVWLDYFICSFSFLVFTEMCVVPFVSPSHAFSFSLYGSQTWLGKVRVLHLFFLINQNVCIVPATFSSTSPPLLFTTAKHGLVRLG